jgi:uncharacterized membrane-anchored protein
VTGRIRKIWGAPFAVLSVAALGAGVSFHRQALRAAASEAARQELGSCCHRAGAAAPLSPVSNAKDTRSKLALGAGLVFLVAAIAPAALAREGDGPPAA